MTTRCFEAHGCTVAVQAPPELDDLVGRHLPSHYVHVEAPPQMVLRLSGRDEDVTAEIGGLHLVGGPGDDTVRAGVSRLEMWVAEHAPEDVLLHAGTVSIGDVAVLVPGRSGAGKSTLVAALLRRGAGYMSDEYAVLSAEGLVSPYPRPLTLRLDDGRRRRAHATEFGATQETRALPLGLIAVLTFRQAGQWQVRSMSGGERTLALLDAAVAARRRPASVLSAVTAAARSAQGVAGTRGDAEHAAEALWAAVTDR